MIRLAQNHVRINSTSKNSHKIILEIRGENMFGDFICTVFKRVENIFCNNIYIAQNLLLNVFHFNPYDCSEIVF